MHVNLSLDMVFPYRHCSLKRKKNINLLLQTSVQISDNLKKNVKKEEMEKVLIGDIRVAAQSLYA